MNDAETATREDLIYSAMERMQARIASHIRDLLGEQPYDERMFGPEQEARRVATLKLVGASDQASSAERHAQFVAKHKAEGWVHGAELDTEKKEHPNLVPWDELPKASQVKAMIFDEVAKTAKQITAI